MSEKAWHSAASAKAIKSSDAACQYNLKYEIIGYCNSYIFNKWENPVSQFVRPPYKKLLTLAIE